MMAATYLKQRFSRLKIITCHLGEGASVCAIDHGRSIDTSMGLTPLEGLVMVTRSGDLDPSIVTYLMRKGLSADEIEELLWRESGMKGLSGLSGDTREIPAAANAGDPKAMLAEGMRLTAALEPGAADILVWSETMVPGDLLERLPLLAELARRKRCWFLAGGVVHGTDPAGRRTGRDHNSAVLLDPRGRLAGRYDKRHLVPFGEYVPLGGRFPGARHLFEIIGTVFSPGDPGAPLPVADGLPLGLSICYEDAFPELVRGYLLRRKGRGADFLVNISNDGWFKGSHELDQHLAICRLRAIEFRTGIVRCCNTGISAIINPDGSLHTMVQDRAGRCKNVEGVAIGRVSLRSEVTFYARHGDVLGKVCLGVVVLILLDALVAWLRARFRRRCKDGVCAV